jgi:hypothetical protein
MAIEDSIRNQGTIQGWINRWYPLAARAVHKFAPVFEDTLGRSAPPLQHTGQAPDRYYRDYLRSMTLDVPKDWAGIPNIST